VEKELQELGSRSWAEATTIVQDRDQWREWISHPVSHRRKRN